jgi:imidazole glycerol-phosphate synthase subunit HisH
MGKVTVIDCGLGNIKSVQRGLEKVGAEIEVSCDPITISKAERLVLPGVGAFEDGMAELHRNNLVKALQDYSTSGCPLLGICLGMQMLLDNSEEHGSHEGLGIIPGSVVKIPKEPNEGERIRKIPHVGWSTLINPMQNQHWDASVISSSGSNEYFYFNHSFMAIPDLDQHVLALCSYAGVRFSAAIIKGGVVGLQFHPEKSGPSGLKILRQFVNS